MSDKEDKAFSKMKVTLPVKIEGSLGARRSVIPPEAKGSGPASLREVFIGTHHVMGLGKDSEAFTNLFALSCSETCRSVIETCGKTDVPNPTFHWVVIVGDYYHELIGGKVKVDILGRITVTPAYQNGHYDGEAGIEHKYEVGLTALTDQQIKSYGEEVIGAAGGIYDVRTNNCQHFVNRLLDKISPGHSVYKTLGPAKSALEISSIPTVGAGPGGTFRQARLYNGATDETLWGKAGRETATSKAKAYMEENTPLITVLKNDGKTGEFRLKALEQLKGVSEDEVRDLSNEFKSKYELEELV